VHQNLCIIVIAHTVIEFALIPRWGTLVRHRNGSQKCVEVDGAILNAIYYAYLF